MPPGTDLTRCQTGPPCRGAFLYLAWDGPVLSWGERLPEVLRVDGAAALRARVREVPVADVGVAGAVVHLTQ